MFNIRRIVMIDKNLKPILVLIALGLWGNIFFLYFKPSPAAAEQDLLGGLVKNYASSAGAEVSAIKKAILSSADGTCPNKKLCGPV